MQETRRQRRVHKGRLNWCSVLLLLIIIYFSSIFISQQTHLHQLAEDQVAAEARLASAKAENEQLRQEKENLGKLDYIEKLAREELGMTRRDELPYSAGGSAVK